MHVEAHGARNSCTYQTIGDFPRCQSTSTLQRNNNRRLAHTLYIERRISDSSK